MDTDWISTVADSAAAFMAMVAVLISVASIFISKRLHSDSTKTSVVEQQYDAFNELGVMRIENPTLNHLLEVPENYKSTVNLVKTSLNDPDPDQKAEIILKERALAMYIFQVFEHSYYQYMHSKELDDIQRTEFLGEVLSYFTGRLLNNPRLLYFWNTAGGNLCVYFEQATQSYYKQNLSTNEDEIFDVMDSIGPCALKERVHPNWQASKGVILSDDERRDYWEKTHCEEGYETVWSMTDDPGVRKKIIDEISRHENAENILIPGCGSRVTLQNEIARCFPNSRILCTDFEGVVEVSRNQRNEKNIIYEARNSTELGFDGEWDIVIIVNSILSESDEENHKIFESCYKALNNGGMLVGFFPTIFASVDIAHLEKTKDRMKYVDISSSSFYEEKQKIWQIFYTPLRLRKILKECGFFRERMEIYFCDSEYFLNHSKKYYGIEDPDLPIYENFVVAYKISG